MFLRPHKNSRSVPTGRIWTLVIAIALTTCCSRSSTPANEARTTPSQPARQALSSNAQASQLPSNLNPTLLETYRKAEAGDVRAMTELADAYLKGDGVPGDPEKAVSWYRKAAEAGDALAMYRLGVMYATGTGVPEENREAAAWFRKGADAGNPDAMYALGRAYENGTGVQEDIQQAVAWYTKAYHHGNHAAKTSLARLGESFEDHD